MATFQFSELEVMKPMLDNSERLHEQNVDIAGNIELKTPAINFILSETAAYSEKPVDSDINSPLAPANVALLRKDSDNRIKLLQNSIEQMFDNFSSFQLQNFEIEATDMKSQCATIKEMTSQSSIDADQSITYSTKMPPSSISSKVMSSKSSIKLDASERLSSRHSASSQSSALDLRTWNNSSKEHLKPVPSNHSLLLRNSMETRESERGIRKTSDMRTAAIKRFRMLKFNSTSTLFVDKSVVNSDLLELLHWASLHISKMIRENHIMFRVKTVDILSEREHYLSKNIRFYEKIPTSSQICRFMQFIFCSIDLVPELVIITIIYLRRMLDATGIHLQAVNWSRSTLGAIILASKVWDDHAVWNEDFLQIFPDVEKSDLNALELYYLAAIEFDVSVKFSDYVRYYFTIRDLSNYLARPWALEPLKRYQEHLLNPRKPKYDEDNSEKKPSKILNDVPPKVQFIKDSTRRMRKVLSDTLYQPLRNQAFIQ